MEMPYWSYQESCQSAQIVYTLGPEVHHDAWHISLIRGQLTRNLARLFSDMHDELAVSCSDEIPVKGDGTS